MLDDPFARWIKEYGQRRHVRDQVLLGADDARKGNLTVVARSFLEDHRADFIKHFDALAEETPDAVFAAVEAAFHLGAHMAAVKFRKEVPVVHMAHARDRKPKEPSPVEHAVRDALTAKTKASLPWAVAIKPKVDKTLRRDVPVNTILYHLKKICREKKIGKL